MYLFYLGVAQIGKVQVGSAGFRSHLEPHKRREQNMKGFM